MVSYIVLASTLCLLLQMTAAQVEYVSRVVQVSSEATSSQNIIGSPDVYPNYGANLPGAWSPIISGSHQFIEVYSTTAKKIIIFFLLSLQVEFNEAIETSTIEVYETYNGGGIIRIDAYDGSSYYMVYSAISAIITESRILSIDVNLPNVS